MTIEVDVVREDDGWGEVDLERIADEAVRGTLTHLDIAAGAVVLLACGDERIAKLNAAFRSQTRPTNVLSWPAEDLAAAEEGGSPAAPLDGELGDIALSWGVCSAEARQAGRPLADHVAHLLVHATLHLLGYDHGRDGDAALMERHEVEILGKMGLADPYSR